MNEDMLEDMKKQIKSLLADNVRWAQVCEDQDKRLDRLERDLAKAQSLLARTIVERDRAVRDLYIGRACSTCAHQYTEKCLLEDQAAACSEFSEGDVPYKWRGATKQKK